MRAIDARARQLNWFVLNAEHDPYATYRWNRKLNSAQLEANQKFMRANFQLPIPLSNMPQALDTITTTYQEVRSFAQDILDPVSICYGAVTACLLPILYALLGTCAYLLRNFEEELRSLTFVPSRQDELGALSHRWHRRIRCRTVQLRPDAGYVNLASCNRIPRWLRS